MRKPAKNTTSAPVVLDDEGTVLGGGEWASVDVDNDRVKAAIEAGDLVVRDELPDGADPDIRTAVGLGAGPSGAKTTEPKTPRSSS